MTRPPDQPTDRVTWLTGDVLDRLADIPDGSVDLVATSPPFLALRNYNDLDGQWGAEESPADFLDRLLELTVEFRRVLAPTGSIAVELGDTYSGSGGSGGDYDRLGMRAGQPKANGSASRTRQDGAGGLVTKGAGRPPRPDRGPRWPLPKSLCGIPTLFAWSLAYGRNLLAPDHQFEPWRIRNIIVWARNNPPVGALGDKVRPATSYITVACPAVDRWFDLDAVRTEPLHGFTSRRSVPFDQPARNVHGQPQRRVNRVDGEGNRVECHPSGSPPLDHWDDEHDGDLTWLINTQGSGLAHYAMWPPSLAERLILSMCPAEVCRSCREPRRRIVATNRPIDRDDTTRAKHANGQRPHPGRQDRAPEVGWEIDRETVGWSDCGHDDYRPGHVLDPFAGTGTTLAVADIHGRRATGIDLDPDNRALFERRYAECWRSLGRTGASPVTEHGQQLGFDLSSAV